MFRTLVFLFIIYLNNMKKILIGFSIGILIYACGNSASSDKAAADTAAAAAAAPKKDVTEDPDYIKGLDLISKNDCLACHKVEEKMTGPAYREVANKYTNDEATIEKLANKVIAGGKGVWGDAAAMTPHPGLSKDDAKAMVKYVLLLKNN